MVAPPPLVGRDAELSALANFVSADGSAGSLLLVGEPGIGKTVLWEAGVAAARDHGLRCLCARASEAETQLSFAGLADLLDGIDREAFAELPAPQLRALEIAVRRAEPAGAPPDPLTISSGLLSALRSLATEDPLLVAVDDVQWLDRQSADALAFVARRVGAPAVRFLFSRRSGHSLDLERALETAGSERLEVSGLSFGAISRLLSERLEHALPRWVLRRLFETSHGNPLFALELGRTLIERGVPEIGAELPLPGLIEDAFSGRLSALAPPLRQLLLTVGLSAGLSRLELAAVADPLALEDAFASGLLIEERSGVRASHPLLAAAAVRRSNAGERRDAHVALAGALADQTLRARHLALAAAVPDADLAATVASAATLAAERGAVHDAVELARHALRLTPPDATHYTDRLLELAQYLTTAGEFARATELLAPRVDTLPAGRARAAAHLLLAEAAEQTPVHDEHIGRAVAESAEDPPLRARALATKAAELAMGRVEQVRAADALAREAVAVARSAGGEVDGRVVVALAWARVMAGHGIDDLTRGAPAGSSLMVGSIDRPAAVQLAFRGQISEARQALGRLSALADERGEARSVAALHVQRCELELRAGEAGEAARLLDEWEQWAASDPVARPLRHRLEALLAAVRGLPERAESEAAATFELIGANPFHTWDYLEARRAIGIAAVFERDFEKAVARLEEISARTAREGVDDPGAFPVAADLVEALVEAGETNAAGDVVERLRRLATEQQHPWGLATARRCEAAIQLAHGYVEDAAVALSEVAATYGGLGLGFDEARSLLFLGRVLRRYKKRGDARRSLEQAAATFARLGCDGWALAARSELARLGGRQPRAEGELTPSEGRVAELAASGLTNKEIAAQLFVSVYTVEGHLKRVYAKLGVRSRNQLSAALKGHG